MVKYYIKQLKYKKNLMGSDSELSLEDQTSIIKMLESNDQETTRLALSIVDKYPRPGIMINHQLEIGFMPFQTELKPVTVNLSFQQYIRNCVHRELFRLHSDGDYWVRDNKEMLKRLQNY